MKSALICQFSAAPLLQGYVKDQKVLPPSDNPITPMRPVCSALESNNGAISDILAEVCTTLDGDGDGDGDGEGDGDGYGDGDGDGDGEG